MNSSINIIGRMCKCKRSGCTSSAKPTQLGICKTYSYESYLTMLAIYNFSYP